MSKPFKPRRGTTAQHASFIGEAHEVTFDTDKKTLVAHDGATPGGFPLAKEADLTSFKATQATRDAEQDAAIAAAQTAADNALAAADNALAAADTANAGLVGVVRAVNGVNADASGDVSLDEIGSDYVRFSSGLQICWAYLSKVKTDWSVTWNFPKPFIAIPSANITIIGTGKEDFNYLAKAYFADQSTTSIRIRTNKNDSVVSFHATVVGRWK